jgi:carbon storage regulator CsrA
LGWHAVATTAMPEIMPTLWEYPMLILTRKAGQRITIGNVVVTITQTSKAFAKIGIEAPDDVRIMRDEVATSWNDPRTVPQATARNI